MALAASFCWRACYTDILPGTSKSLLLSGNRIMRTIFSSDTCNARSICATTITLQRVFSFYEINASNKASVDFFFSPSVKNRSWLKCIAHLCLPHGHSQVSPTLPERVRMHSTLPSGTPEDQTRLLVLHSILRSYPLDQHGYRPHCAVFAHTTLPLTSTELLSE